jgi:hypothetical protein
LNHNVSANIRERNAAANNSLSANVSLLNMILILEFKNDWFESKFPLKKYHNSESGNWFSRVRHPRQYDISELETAGIMYLLPHFLEIISD